MRTNIMKLTLFICAIIEILTERYTPVWSTGENENLHIYDSESPPLSYTTGDTEAQTVCDSEGKCTLIIDNVKYSVGTAFREVDSVFKPNDTSYIICPKEQNSHLYIMENLSTPEAPKLTKIPNSAELDNCKTNPYTLSCSRYKMSTAIFVTFINGCHVLVFDYSTSKWSSDKILDIRSRILKSVFNPSQNAVFALYSDNNINQLEVIYYKIFFSNDNKPSKSTELGRKSLGNLEIGGQVEAAFTVTDNSIKFHAIIWDEGKKTFHVKQSEEISYNNNDESNNSQLNSAKLISNNMSFPLKIEHPYKFQQLKFLNSKPVCTYLVEDDFENLYWGMADLEKQAILFNSNIPIKTISPIVDSTDNKYNFIVTQETSYMMICPQGTGYNTCSKCENDLLLDPPSQNYCIKISTTGSNTEPVGNGDKIHICQVGFFYNKNDACEQCSGFTFLPSEECIDSCDETKYETNTQAKTCTYCKGLNKYYDKDQKKCVNTLEEGYYETDSENRIISKCTSPCKGCKLQEDKIICLSCFDENYFHDNTCVSTCSTDTNIYVNHINDEGIKTCATCPSIKENYVKVQGSDECIDKTVLGDSYYFIDYPNGLVKKCNDGCNSCSQNSLCESCNENLYQSPSFQTSPQCVSSCTISNEKYGKYTESGVKKCVKCSSIDNHFRYEDNEDCIQPSGTVNKDYVVIETTFGIIANCPAYCEVCSVHDNTPVCTKCNSNSILVEDKCILTCEKGEGLLNMECVNCKTAVPEKEYYLIDGDYYCIEAKPTRYFISDTEKNILSKCDETCLECSGGPIENNNQCTECSGDKVLNYELKNCLSECDSEFLIKDTSTKKCINCKDNNDGNTVLIYNENKCSQPPSSKDNPTYVISPSFGVINYCDANCLECQLAKQEAPYDSICTKCQPTFYMKYNTDECASSCSLSESEPDNFFVKNEQTTKCEKCSENTNGNIYKLKDGTECIAKPIDTAFVVIDSKYGIIEKCHVNCEVCNEGPSENDNKCTKCKEGTFMENVLKNGNCVSKCGNYLYENSEDRTCDNCKLKGTDKEMFYYEGKCVEGQPEGTVLIDENTNGLKNCYVGCKTCSKEDYNENEHKCNECRNGFMPDPLIPSNCISECNRDIYKWYFDESNIFHCLDTEGENCPSTFPLLIEHTNECVQSCPFNMKYSHNGICIQTCPNGYTGNEQNECVEIVNSDDNENTVCKERTNELNVQYTNVESLIKEQINIFIDYINNNEDPSISNNNFIDVITGGNITVFVFSNFTCAEHSSLNLNFSYANISSCINILKQYHSLPDTHSFIIGQSELKRPTESTNQLSGYIISDIKGTVYDLSPCQNETIPITYPLLDTNIEDFNSTKEFFLETGINLYDSSAPFFNEFCHPYHDEYNNDVILQDRRNHMFKNTTLCENGCKYSNIDFKSNRVYCDCQLKEDSFDDINTNTPMNDFPSSLHKTNLKVLKCHNLVFDNEHFAHNAGGFVMIGVLVLTIPSTIHLFLVGFKPMYSTLNSLSVDIEPNDNNIEDNEHSLSNNKNKSNDINNNNSIDSENKPNPPHKTSSTTIEPNSSNNIIEQQSQVNNQRNNESSTLQLSQPVKLPLKDATEKDCPITLTESNLNVGTFTQLGEKQIKNTSSHFDNKLSDSVLDNASYEDALIYDTRNIFKIYWRCIQHRLFILNIFMNSSPYEPITSKVIGVLLILAVILTLNGMFFSERYISKRYHAQDNVNGKFVFRNEIPKTVYASLIAVVLCFCVEWVLNTRKCFKEVEKKEKDKEKFLEETKKISKCVKIRIIMFVVVSVLIMGFCWYYVSAFCGVYQKTQGGLFVGLLFSVVFLYLFQAILALGIALMRYSGITCKCACLYKSSEFLM